MPRPPMADHWRAAGRWPPAPRRRPQHRWGAAPAAALALVLLLAAKLPRPPAVTLPSSSLAGTAGIRPSRCPPAQQELAAGLRARLLPGGELRRCAGARRAGEEEGPESDADWRDFRAKLVERELRENGGEDGETQGGEAERPGEQGWAYATPLIEQGSLLLSAPGDHFAINQQYFHKTVIFIVEHTSDFTRGIILNRPTAFNTGDMGSFSLSPELELPREFVNGTDRWNVWCGGDCQGLSAREDPNSGAVYYCLHTLERLADMSSQIIRGVFMIELQIAQRLVESGDADKDDFLLVVGYCGWAPGQLQGELDRGDTWTMAAADRGVLLGRLREAQASLTVRVEGAQAALTSGGDGLTAADVGDGIAEWEHLYRALGPAFSASLAEDGEGGKHTDEMLRRWINRCLIPPRLQAEPEFPSSPSALNAAGSETRLSSGAVIRGSPTAWLLGKPAERPLVNQAFSRAPPGQYLHKGVLLLLRDYSSSDYEPALMVLLNGPKVGEMQNSSDTYNVYFGGPDGVGGSAGVFEMKGPTPYRFKGMVLLGSRVLGELLDMGALEVAEGVGLDDVLAVPAEQRWEAAGGRIATLREASTSQLADVQRRKWYKTFLDLDLSSGA